MDLVYSAARAVFWPPLRYGLQWTIEGVEHIPAAGPVILASNHVSYLDPLTLAYVADQQGRRIRFLAKAELFDMKGLGTLLRAAHQIPVQRGKADAADALAAAVAACDAGECVTVFPEGTISQDLEPMRAKSGVARLAQQTKLPVVPVGLWGSHRILTKGRKPAWQWGVAETAVVGAPVPVVEGEHVKAMAARVMDAIAECVAQCRAIYPQRPKPGGDPWWWREPESATVHQRSA